MPPLSARGRFQPAQAPGGAVIEETEWQRNWIFVCVSFNWKHNSSIYWLHYDFVFRFNLGAVRVDVISPFFLI